MGAGRGVSSRPSGLGGATQEVSPFDLPHSVQTTTVRVEPPPLDLSQYGEAVWLPPADLEVAIGLGVIATAAVALIWVLAKQLPPKVELTIHLPGWITTLLIGRSLVVIGIVIASVGFLSIETYVPRAGIAGLLWNVLNATIRIGDVMIPYRLVMAAGVLVAAVGMLTGRQSGGRTGSAANERSATER